ncbi:MAG: GAF domain-containing protein [Candidatus Eremiobacteraeota bacterium]|nr:GAF domain-containing protein [Candidatus Eremiobacteraeota bacterium]
MAYLFPQEISHRSDPDYQIFCQQGCLSLMETVADLTGLSLALFSSEKEQVSPPFNLNEFCYSICSGNAPDSIIRMCFDFHNKLFEKAVTTHEKQVEECPFKLKAFVLPLKSKQNDTLVYVIGGHSFSGNGKELPRELTKDFDIPYDEINETYKKTSILDDLTFERAIEKLSVLSDIYNEEMLREEQDLKFSRVVNFVSDLARHVSDKISLKELLLNIVDRVSAAFDVERCAIALWDDRRQFIKTFATNSEYDDRIFSGEIIPDKGSTGIVAHTGKTFFSYDAKNDKRLYQVQINDLDIKSLLSVPLKVGDRIIGCMHLMVKKERRIFRKKEVEFAEALASEISLLVEIARLYNISQKKAHTLERSREEMKSYFIRLGTALSTGFNLKQLLKIIVELSIHLTHSDAGSIYLIENKKLTRYIAMGYEDREKDERDDDAEFKRGTLDRSLTAYTSEEYLRKKLAAGEINSYLGIPMERKGEVKGMLNILDSREREFTPEEVEMLTIFAEHAALAIDNARLFEHEQKKAREAMALYQAAKSIRESVNLDEVLRQSTEQLTRVAGVDRCLIMLLDFKKLELQVAAEKGLSEDQRDLFSYYKIPIDEIADHLWGELIQGKPLLLSGAPDNCPALEPFFMVFPTSSCIMVPLFTKEQLTGLIYLDDSRISHSFTESQIRLVMTLSIQIASAAQRAKLVEQLEMNLDQLKALHQVSTAVTGTLSLPKVFELVVDKVSHLIDVPAASILTLDEGRKEYVLRASRGLVGELADPEFQKLISTKTAKRKRSLTYYVSSKVEGEDPLIYETLSHASKGGYISVPLIARKRVVGVLNCFCIENDRFDGQEIRLLRSFANQSAIAVENARLHLIIKNKVRELATVFEVGKSITSTLNLDKVLDGVCSSVKKVMNADAVSIMNLDEQNQVLEIIKTNGLGKYHRGETIKVGAGIAGIAAKTGRPMILHNEEDTDSPYKFPSRVKRDGLKTILSVPLKSRGRVLGLLNIYKKPIFHFSNNEINLLSTLANQAAVAIENARLYNEQYNIAQIIRQNLMPQKEMSYDDIDVGSIYIPSEILSGDYFEVIPVSEKRYGLVISDVSGKGTGAAIYNARAKYILRSYAKADYSPSEILTLLNQMMEEETSEDKFISILYMDLDMEADEMICASAGHEPLIIWDNHEKEALVLNDQSNIPIGIFPDTTYKEKLYKIHRGDILLLYTDGITEARARSGEFFGTDRLVELVSNNFHLNAQALANKIHTNVQKFTRRKITDDFSLLVVRV